MRHSARGRAGLGLGAWLLAGPALAAPPVGFVEGGPWTGSGPAPVTVALLILVESGEAPRDEARALRQLLEHSHRAGVWPAQVAFRPQSLSALMAADRDLPRLLAELQPVLLLVGPAGADDGLAACAALGRALDRVPASGGGRVGELLREDTDLMPLARSRSDEAQPLMADWGIVPSPRLLAGSGSGRSTVEDLARWQRSWDLARRMASGPSRVAPADAEAALDALASLAALARSVGLDPFVVPGLDRLLDARTRAALPPWRWPLAALPLERARLLAAVEADPAASTAALAATLGPSPATPCSGPMPAGRCLRAWRSCRKHPVGPAQSPSGSKMCARAWRVRRGWRPRPPCWAPWGSTPAMRPRMRRWRRPAPSGPRPPGRPCAGPPPLGCRPVRRAC